MKKTIAACLAAVLLSASLAFGGWKAYNEYTVLSSEEVAELQVFVQQAQMRAFIAGQRACNSTISQ